MHIRPTEEDHAPANTEDDHNSHMETHVHFNSIMATSSSSSSSNSSSSSSSDSDSSGEEDEAVITFVAPDGGWGWVIVMASFMVNLVADGVTFSFGVIFVELLKEFGRSKAFTAGVVSLVHAVPLISGPVASALTDRFGCRRMTILGSILASIGFVLSAMADNLYLLYITFGLIAGFGLSLCFVSAIVIVAIYFERRRSLATGISTCGSGVGTFLFAPLTQVLIDKFGGWRGAVLGLAFILSLMVVCGLFFKDLDAWVVRRKHRRSKSKTKKRKRKKEDETDVDSKSHSRIMPDVDALRSWLLDPSVNANSMRNHHQPMSSPLPSATTAIFYNHEDYNDQVRVDVIRKTASLCLLPRSVRETSVTIGEGDTNDNDDADDDDDNHQPNATTSKMTKQSSEPGCRRQRSNPRRHRRHLRVQGEATTTTTTTTSATTTVRTSGLLSSSSLRLSSSSRHRPSLTYRGAVLNVNRYRLRASSCPDINAAYNNFTKNHTTNLNLANKGSRDEQGGLLYRLSSLLSECCGPNTGLMSVKFALFCISNFILYAWYDVMYVYLVDYAEQDLQVDSTDATMLLSLMGLTNTLGEIVIGWLGDRVWVDVNVLYTLCMIACGIATAIVPLCTRYTSVSLLAALYGLGISANYSLTSSILVELVSLDDFSHTYGFLLMVQGISNLIGPPFAGYLHDLTHEWLLTFGLAGVFIVLSGLLLLVLPFLGHFNKSLSREGVVGRGHQRHVSGDTSFSSCSQPDTQLIQNTSSGLNDVINRL